MALACAHVIVYLATKASWTSYSIQIPNSFGFEFVRHVCRTVLPQFVAIKHRQRVVVQEFRIVIRKSEKYLLVQINEQFDISAQSLQKVPATKMIWTLSTS